MFLKNHNPYFTVSRQCRLESYMAQSQEKVSNNVGFDSQSNEENDREPAKVVRGPHGGATGVAIYLTADDLRSLGMDPSGVDEVIPRVVSGAVVVDPV